jgi:2-dehydropantoate 2-reductase
VPVATPARVLVVGCGGIGGVVSARLAHAGVEVTCATHNPKIAEAINAEGLRASWDGVEHRVDVTAHATLPDEELGSFDILLLAVAPDIAERAVAEQLPFLVEGATIVCFPNGLIEERLAKTLDPARLVGAIISFGATMHGPGHVEQTSPGRFTVGSLDGQAGPRVDEVASLLERAGPVVRTDNLRGARWSKLALNCAISSLGAVSGLSLGPAVRRRIVRRLVLETMTEVARIAELEGVKVTKIAGTLDLDWLALTPKEMRRRVTPALMAKHAVLLAVGFKYRSLRSSTLRALERGRKPSVDFLNGEITQRAERYGVPAPVNLALQRTVHAIAAGEKSSSVETLRELYAATRIGAGRASAQ